jgi:hypothetical protein
MRKAVFPLLVALTLAALPLSAQENGKKKGTIDLDEEFFHLPDSITDDYLDNAPIAKKTRINDYWIVGVHGGVSVQHGYFNPPRQVSLYLNKPVYGFSVTRFATMMNTFPIVGMEVGWQHNFEGYNFKEFESDGFTYRQDIDGAYEAYMEVPEVFFLTHGHYDFGQYVKAIVKAGMFGGYRTNITRIGPRVKEEYVNAFKDTDNRWTYGVQGGLGIGVMLDPVEIHLGVQFKWGWSSFYQPDVASPYYYRFAYPLDGAITLGVYYQLSKRRGHTRLALRRLARQMVQEEMENPDRRPAPVEQKEQ